MSLNFCTRGSNTWQTTSNADSYLRFMDDPITYMMEDRLDSPLNYRTAYPIPTPIVVPPGASWSTAYPQLKPQQTYVQTPPNGYYIRESPDIYASPIPIKGVPVPYYHPFDPQQPTHYIDQSGHAILSPSTMPNLIPQYYPVTADKWTEAGSNSAEGKRRKNAKHVNTPPMTTKPIKTPRSSSRDASPAAPPTKRMKMKTVVEESAMDDERSRHLPTPPPSGHQLPQKRLPSMDSKDDFPLSSAGTSESGTSRQPRVSYTDFTEEFEGVVIVKHPLENRKLAIQGRINPDEVIIEQRKSATESYRAPRMGSLPAVQTDASGRAIFTTTQALELEIAFLEGSGGDMGQGEGRGSSPRSSPDPIQLQTPKMSQDEMVVEVVDSPNSKGQRVAKLLSMFDLADSEIPMPPLGESKGSITTSSSEHGRLALSKDVAKRLLELPYVDDLVESTLRVDIGMDVFGERSRATASEAASRPRSAAARRPDWPDEAFPWNSVWDRSKEKRRREEGEKTRLLKRYLEADSDGSDDEWPAEMRSSRRTERSGPSHRLWTPPATDAKQALLHLLKHKLPPIQLACPCNSSADMGPLIQCGGCRLWHHLLCSGATQDSPFSQWWCTRCREAALALSTPARPLTPSQSFTQSNERSSAFKGEVPNIALAPSPMFPTSGVFAQYGPATTSHKTPANRASFLASPTSRQHKSRILSEMWAYTEDGAPSSAAPSTPGPSRSLRFSTPRFDETPFDVNSTPSRHLDFPTSTLFSLTPLGGPGRKSLSGFEYTPFPTRMSFAAAPQPAGTNAWANVGAAASAAGSGASGDKSGNPLSRHDFLNALGKAGESPRPLSPGGRFPQSPGARFSSNLVGAHHLSPSPLAMGSGRRSGTFSRSTSGSMRSGLGLGVVDADD